ncbi:hypothetical protein HHI36_014030 [Cryptolaemus montrouzieri]|uniref:Insulin receptor substrate 1 n=1 Tax=Cryptolaemus montrouzieri TaxID=559131 RepID=A0ABD2N1N1_9CUCU
METEDPFIAQNVHSTVYHSMTKNGKNDELGPKSRIRSSSATETSKPNAYKKQYSKGHIFSQDHSQNNELPAAPSHLIQNTFVSGMVTIYHHLRGTTKSSERRHSISGGVAFSGSISHQRTQSLPLATPATAPEYPLQQHTRSNKRTNQSKCITSGGRERCDSMPSRARTASEGNHPIQMFPSSRSHLAPHRPCSIYRDLGSSPTIGSPISPPSACASTDSAGSSYSLVDENEDLDSNHGRYGHSLTPDEAIAEEDCDSLCVPYGISPTTGDYLPMAPASSDDGYVDMSPKGHHGNITPAASLSSVTSGTPSTDMRFAEYQLDKVMSFFPPSSDEESRPIRAYSVGSRPENCRYKKHLMDVQGIAESRRDRAASVGSKTKKGPIRVLPPHGHYPHVHPKSSSAPLLSSSRIPGSLSSVGSEMGDLMEMDFTNTSKKSLNCYLEMKPCGKPSLVNQTSNSSGYVEMKPGVIPPNMSNSGPYLEMKPGSSPTRNNEYTYMDLSRTHNNRTEPRNDYMDMNAKNASNKPVLTNNNYTYGNYSDYTEMNHHQPMIKRSYSQLSPSAGQYYRNTSSPNSDYLDMHCNNRARNDSDRSNDGYVEMSLGKGHHRQSSLDSAQLRREDYAMMTSGSSLKNKENKPNKNDTNRSLPITISNSHPNTNSTPMYGRIYSGNSPKMQLPLTNTTTSPSSSLPRGRKNSTRRDSRDSSSSSVTTPSNSSTIFPLSLNSPSSPVKPVKTPERSTPSFLLNSLYRKIRGKSNDSQEDYTVMDFQKKGGSKGNQDMSEYINLDLSKMNLNGRTCVEGEYAKMQPSKKATPESKAFSLSTLTETSSRGFKPISETRESGPSPPLSSSSSMLPTTIPTSGNDTQKTDESQAVKSDTKRSDSLNSDSGSSKPVSRPGSASSDLCSSTSTLVGSRPDSVNSDSIRPSSTSSLHYANLDLQTIDDDGDSRSPRRNNSNDSNQEGTFTYAEIDFNKSEELKKIVKN